MVVSCDRGTPNSTILMGFSVINPPLLGTPINGNPCVGKVEYQRFGVTHHIFVVHIHVLVVYTHLISLEAKHVC